MEKYSVTSSDKLRQLCIKNNWFTSGSIEQYDKLFYANTHGFSIEDIATIIWICCEGIDREYILNDLIVAKREYDKYNNWNEGE